MIERSFKSKLLEKLRLFPVVALIGPRQVGKTTLAYQIAGELSKESVYLDLERDSHLNRLNEPELYLSQQSGKCVIIDEVQRKPELFPLIRSLVDERKREGEKSAQFLILGSASKELLKQSSESLAGRIAYLELTPFGNLEVVKDDNKLMNQHWIRGGYPDSFLAVSKEDSMEWRRQFISTFVERDLNQLGVDVSSEGIKRLWSMLAYSQGSILNASNYADGLGVSSVTVKRYIDVLTEMFMLRQLPAWSGNSSKRLIKSPKVFVRDSGLLHCLADINTEDKLYGHHLCGMSWEGYIIENIINHLPKNCSYFYYRTRAGAEIDFVIERDLKPFCAVEIKRSVSPKIEKGFYLGMKDIGVTKGFVIAPVNERHHLKEDIEVLGLREFLRFVENL